MICDLVNMQASSLRTYGEFQELKPYSLWNKLLYWERTDNREVELLVARTNCKNFESWALLITRKSRESGRKYSLSGRLQVIWNLQFVYISSELEAVFCEDIENILKVGRAIRQCFDAAEVEDI